jgi:hypothetical protein
MMSQILSGAHLRRAGLVLAGLALTAVVWVPGTGAASSSPSPTSSSSIGGAPPAPASDPAGAAGLERSIARHPLLAGTLRADLTVVRRDGSTAVVHYERGTISAVGATSITVTGRDGKGATFAVTDATRVLRDGHPISIAALKAGDRVFVFGTTADGTLTAFLVRAPKAVGAG